MKVYNLYRKRMFTWKRKHIHVLSLSRSPVIFSEFDPDNGGGGGGLHSRERRDGAGEERVAAMPWQGKFKQSKLWRYFRILFADPRHSLLMQSQLTKSKFWHCVFRQASWERPTELGWTPTEAAFLLFSHFVTIVNSPLFTDSNDNVFTPPPPIFPLNPIQMWALDKLRFDVSSVLNWVQIWIDPNHVELLRPQFLIAPNLNCLCVPSSWKLWLLLNKVNKRTIW